MKAPTWASDDSPDMISVIAQSASSRLRSALASNLVKIPGQDGVVVMLAILRVKLWSKRARCPETLPAKGYH